MIIIFHFARYCVVLFFLSSIIQDDGDLLCISKWKFIMGENVSSEFAFIHILFDVFVV